MPQILYLSVVCWCHTEGLEQVPLLADGLGGSNSVADCRRYDAAQGPLPLQGKT